MNHDTVEAIKAAPPAGAFLAWIGGLDLQQWVLVATLIYTCLLITEKVYKIFRSHHDSRRKGPG